MYQHGSQWMVFREILDCGLLCKSVEKIYIWLKSGATDEDVSTSLLAGEIILPQECSLRVKPYQAARTAEKVKTLHYHASVNFCIRCLSHKALTLNLVKIPTNCLVTDTTLQMEGHGFNIQRVRTWQRKPHDGL
jgi:hypothetical protein